MGDASVTEGEMWISRCVTMKIITMGNMKLWSTYQATVPSEDMEEREEEEVPLRRKRGKAPMPDLEIPTEFLAEDAQASHPREETFKSRLVPAIYGKGFGLGNVPLVLSRRAKELDELLRVMKNTDLVDFDDAVAVQGYSKQPVILKNYENICICLEKDRLLSAQYNLFRPKPAIGMLLLLGVLFRQFKRLTRNPMSVFASYTLS
ncbi:hypothetical protein Tco_1505891 [Tanacetum coccineum]